MRHLCEHEFGSTPGGIAALGCGSLTSGVAFFMFRKAFAALSQEHTLVKALFSLLHYMDHSRSGQGEKLWSIPWLHERKCAQAGRLCHTLNNSSAFCSLRLPALCHAKPGLIVLRSAFHSERLPRREKLGFAKNLAGKNSNSSGTNVLMGKIGIKNLRQAVGQWQYGPHALPGEVFFDISHAFAYFQLTYAAWFISTSRPSRPSRNPSRKK